MMFPDFQFMPQLSKWRIYILGALVSLGAVDLGARDWFRYETAHFELYSEGMKYGSRQLIDDLELMHQIVTGVIGDKQMVDRKTRVIIFAKERSVVSWAPDEIVASSNAPRVVYEAVWIDQVINELRKPVELYRLPVPEVFGDMKQWNAGVAEVFRESTVANAKRRMGDIPTMRSFATYQEDASQIVMSWEPGTVYSRKRAFKSYVQLRLRGGGLSGSP